MNWKTTLTVAGSTFVGGALGWLAQHLGDVPPTTGAAWRAAAIGAAWAGVVALYHLYLPQPGVQS